MPSTLRYAWCSCSKRDSESFDHALYVNSSLTKLFAKSTDSFAKGFSALHFAARRGTEEMVARLLLKGVRSDQRSLDGSTPLHLAAALGHKGVCTMLLIRGGASHHFKNDDGDTVCASRSNLPSVC